MVDKLKVGVLGSTGVVGQRFVSLLSNHPWFEIEFLAASPRKSGIKYGEAVEWVIEDPLPEGVDEMVLTDLSSIVKGVADRVDLIFSALPSDVALDYEIPLVRRGLTVVSNSSPLRLDPVIPLLNPEVNWDHIKLLEAQRRVKDWPGVLIKNPNCSTAILTLTLGPLMRLRKLRRVVVVTLQAVSGAGLKGVPSMKILDNVIPYIPKEEGKIVSESKKILGNFSGDRIVPADMAVTAVTTRVPVLDGHLEVVHVEFEGDVSLDEVKYALKSFRSLPQELSLPSAPTNPVIVRDEEDRPQPRLDRNAGGGMSVTVGRLKKALDGEDTWIKYVVLGHNTIRGAAGVATLIAELYVKLSGLR